MVGDRAESSAGGFNNRHARRRRSTRTLLLETADAATEGTGTVDLGDEHVDIRLRTQSKHLTIAVLPRPIAYQRQP
jgi:hypothetical protein